MGATYVMMLLVPSEPPNGGGINFDTKEGLRIYLVKKEGFSGYICSKGVPPHLSDTNLLIFFHSTHNLLIKFNSIQYLIFPIIKHKEYNIYVMSCAPVKKEKTINIM